MQKKQFKGAFIAGILAVLLGACTTETTVENLKGSGVGGIIEIDNQTISNLYVTWSGTGCAGVTEGLSLVCETATIPSEASSAYGYNWGVTTTWLNVATSIDSAADVHPCSSPLPPEQNEACIFDHYVVDTKANKTDRCVITKSASTKKYNIACNRL